MSGREKSAWVHNFLADAPRDFTQGSKIQEKEVWRFEITKKLSFPYSRCLKITKSIIQHCERSELRLHFEWTKVYFKNAKNGPFWRVFENLMLAVKQCYQTGHF